MAGTVPGLCAGHMNRTGRIATLTATTALTLALPFGGAASVASAEPADTAPAVASKPDGPLESSLAVLATGAIAGAGTILIVRRHHRRNRGGRR